MDYAPQIAKLAEALKALGVVTLRGGHFDSDDNAVGELHYPEGVASLLVGALADGDGLLVMPRNWSPQVLPPEPEPEGDPFNGDQELTLLAMVIEAFDEMSDLAVARCMSYLGDRYPPE